MEGTKFGRYRLQHLIGRGGMGEVWRAFDTETQRVVAIKLLPTDTATDDSFIERFRREARVAAALNSPNIVAIHNFGEIDGRLYVDMALIDGRDLEEVLGDGPMRPGRAVRIIEQVAAALRAAHDAGLVHRDVKPSNILVNRDDFAYLIDFGLARTDDDAGLTVTGHTVGTLTYMAPERYDTRPVDLRTDVYSLACVLYQCLTGQRPYPGSGSDQMIAHISMPPPRPTDFADLPRGFDPVIETGMAKEPAQRYQTVTEFARAARAALSESRPPSYDFSYPTTHPGRPAVLPPPQPAYRSAAADNIPAQSIVPRLAPAPPAWRRKPVLVIAACVVVSMVAITSTLLVLRRPGVVDEAGWTVAQRSGNTTTVGDATYGEQVTLPSEGLEQPRGLAATSSGGVVGQCCRGALYDITDDAERPTFHAYRGITAPGVALDGNGGLYVAGAGIGVQRLNDRLQGTKLPFPPLDNPRAIAANEAGAVGVLNLPNDSQAAKVEVWLLAPGATAAVKLPFDSPTGETLAIDSRGVVYAGNLMSRSIWQLEPGAAQPTEVRLGEGIVVKTIAAGADDAVYIGSEGETSAAVYRILPGGAKPEKLPFEDFGWDPSFAALAVNDRGDVFVVDARTNSVVKLPRVDG